MSIHYNKARGLILIYDEEKGAYEVFSKSGTIPAPKTTKTEEISKIMQSIQSCPDCGQPLESRVFYLHHAMTHELDWLVDLRRQMGAEQNLSAVIVRLLRLEISKRKGIEEQKARRKQQ